MEKYFSFAGVFEVEEVEEALNLSTTRTIWENDATDGHCEIFEELETGQKFILESCGVYCYHELHDDYTIEDMHPTRVYKIIEHLSPAATPPNPHSFIYNV